MTIKVEDYEQYIKDSMRLMNSLVNRYRNSGVDKDDLEGIALIGLTKALHSYNSSRKAQFSTYAYSCMRNEILHHFRKENLNTKNTVLYNDVFYTGKDGGELTFEECLTTGTDDVVESSEITADNEVLYNALKQLGEKERFVLIHRYGLMGADELTQVQIAEAINMSQPFVCRLEKELMCELRKMVTGKLNFEEKLNQSDTKTSEIVDREILELNKKHKKSNRIDVESHYNRAVEFNDIINSNLISIKDAGKKKCKKSNVIVDVVIEDVAIKKTPITNLIDIRNANTRTAIKSKKKESQTMGNLNKNLIKTQSRSIIPISELLRIQDLQNIKTRDTIPAEAFAR